MNRDLDVMAAADYDLLIIGGGITGACVAWDAALRGLRTALVEKGDFGGATTAATSKLIHGGLRYLKNLEFNIVRESLVERRLLQVLAPHLVRPIPFLIPTYRFGVSAKTIIRAALTIYDLFAYDRDKGVVPELRIPRHRMLSVAETIRMEPDVIRKGLSGAGIYYDCQVTSPENHCLAFIRGAAEKGTAVANYAEVTGLIVEDRRVKGANVRDRIGGRDVDVRARVTVNLAGPWADIVSGFVTGKVEHKVVRSKGIHIVTRPLVEGHGLVLRTTGGSHFFIIPWRGHSLIGTTDTLYEGDPDAFKVTRKDVADLIRDVNKAYPVAGLCMEDVLYFYGGMRPIVDKETKTGVYDASRRYEIYDHFGENGIDGLFTVIGGKYTTSRNLAQKLVDRVYVKLGETMRPCVSDRIHLPGGDIPVLSAYVAREARKRPQGLDEEVVGSLIGSYGTKYVDVLKRVEADAALGESVCEGRSEILAEIAYAAEDGIAQTLSDAIFRRTGIGTLGNPGEKALARCADVMGGILGWEEDRKAREVGEVLQRYVHTD